MTISRITKRVDALGSAWEQFKSINDRRLSEIEKKGAADAVTVDHLNKINNAMDGYKSRLNGIETAISRPTMGVEYAGSNDSGISEHKAAFCNYLRKGAEDDLAFLEQKALSVGVDSDGGFLVTPHMSANIAKTIFETSPLRQIASVETISTDSLEVIEDSDEAASGWTTETGVVTETTSPTIGKKVIPLYELYAQPKATQKLIDDSSIDIESWLSSKLVDSISRQENTAFISGNGTGQPTGILSYPAGTGTGQVERINSGTSAVVTADSIIDLYYALKEEYATHATFLMNRATAQAVRLLKDSSNQYIWQPGLSAGAPDMLMGVPVMQAADMPAPAANSLSIVVGDFSRAYQIVDRAGVRVLRDPYTEKPFVKFYATKRVGGDVINTEALKILSLSA